MIKFIVKLQSVNYPLYSFELRAVRSTVNRLANNEGSIGVSYNIGVLS